MYSNESVSNVQKDYRSSITWMPDLLIGVSCWCTESNSHAKKIRVKF